ncbi:MAG: 3-hydroxyacyl-CoA dehydrogenase family protein [bacterium]|nr:3-hydroxyacyl-CoA dehydrogenase family protein [bacterium]
MKNVLVIGSGTMGCGIAQCLAEHQINVFLTDTSTDVARKALSKISERLQRNVDSGEITAQYRNDILERIKIVEDIERAKNAQLVIEAIIEDIETKKGLFSQLDRLFSKEIILASNTSSLSITELAASTVYPERVAGMHFFNPAHRMKLVEIVKGEKTSEKTIETIKKLAEFIGKIPVEVRDSPGFIVNRLLIPMINEAAILVEENIAKMDSIDAAMKFGAGHPMGPLALADLIGIDVCVHILENLEKQLSNPKYKPCNLLKQMVKENKLGKKTGQGFYSY